MDMALELALYVAIGILIGVSLGLVVLAIVWHWLPQKIKNEWAMKPPEGMFFGIMFPIGGE